MTYTEPPALALAATLRHALTPEPPELWGERVHLDYVPAGSQKPYVLVTVVSCTETGKVKAEDAEAIVAVKCVAKDLAQAGTGAARLVALLRDKGTQDTSANPLNGGAEWQISYTRKLTDIHLTELVSGSEPVFHAGAQFKVRMERI